MKKKVAISSCLLGNNCKYNGDNNLNSELIDAIKDYDIVEFCPEDYAFGTPRETMDLVMIDNKIEVISTQNQTNLSQPIKDYAINFFDKNSDIKLFIGKDRSPSCGVKSSKLYNSDKILISYKSTGLMAKEAIKRGIESKDATMFVGWKNPTFYNYSSI